MENDTKNKINKKKLLIIAAVFIIGFIFIFNFFSSIEYGKNIKSLSKKMTETAVLAENMTNGYSRVWDDSIKLNRMDRYSIAQDLGVNPKVFYKNTSKIGSGDVSFDFDTSLASAKEYYVNTGVINQMKDNLNYIDDEMKKLNNPPSKYKNSYSILLNMYSNLNSFCDLAISPSGSLLSFNKNINNLDQKIAEEVKTFQSQLPN